MRSFARFVRSINLPKRLSMVLLRLLLSLSVLFLSLSLSLGNPNCQKWADMGECERNPSYMLKECQAACQTYKDQLDADTAKLAKIQSVYDFQIPDIDGKTVDFAQFKDQVVILTNVASYCGYTESHYRSLVELYAATKSQPIHILVFPCNQFGQQEPGTNEEIKAFAKGKGVEFTVMDKVDVNGPAAHLLYKYLKQQTGISAITWNFATYFVISPDGTVSQHSGVEPLQLQSHLVGLLKEEL